MNKIQLTITDQERDLISFKAASLGFNVTKFIKFLISREAFSVAEEIPTFQLSKKAEKKIAKAHKEHLEGKSIELKSIDDLDKFV
ncbi:hypothetical protein ISS85_04340 [Candidatus Microgenomates bacterium]|nr:hypothetical protein [Candidatus Microgenomates bacterium]